MKIKKQLEEIIPEMQTKVPELLVVRFLEAMSAAGGTFITPIQLI